MFRLLANIVKLLTLITELAIKGLEKLRDYLKETG